MRIIDWSSYVCPSEPLARCAGALSSLSRCHRFSPQGKPHMTTVYDRERAFEAKYSRDEEMAFRMTARRNKRVGQWAAEKMKLTAEETDAYARAVVHADFEEAGDDDRSEEHTSELQSLMRSSYAVFCLKKKI